MNKTILNPSSVEEIILRIGDLKADQSPLWGKMTATEMLVHCNLAHQSIMKAPLPTEKVKFKQRIFKFIFFRVRKEFPKLARGPKRFDMKGKVDDVLFLEEKSKFVHIVGKFSKLENPMQGAHPAFGPLRNQDWGIFVWRHLDHHLRQFGV